MFLFFYKAIIIDIYFLFVTDIISLCTSYLLCASRLCLGDMSPDHFSRGPCSGLQFASGDTLWAAKAKQVGKIAGIGAGCVLAVPFVLAGGAIVLVGGLIALPVIGAVKAVKALSDK